MPRKSFLLVPLEATDPVVEDSGGFRHGTHSSEASPTPRKSLFEMNAEDLRAAEQAWLEKVGSFRASSPHAALSAKGIYEHLSVQQHDSIPPDLGTIAEGADVTAAFPRMSSSELILPGSDTTELSRNWGAITAYREPESTDAIFVSEAQSPQLLGAEQASSIPIRNSLTLRQRFSIMQAAGASVIPDQGTTQDVALPKAEPPAGGSVGHDSDTHACDQEVSDGDQTAGTSNAAASKVVADPCQEPSITSETFHMPRTPWMNLKTIERPSASWRRLPQLHKQDTQDSASTDTVEQTALPDQAQDSSSMPAPGDPSVLGTRSAGNQQQVGSSPCLQSNGKGAYTFVAASSVPDDWAGREHSAVVEGSDAKSSDSTHAAQPGLSTLVSEQQMGRPEINHLRSSWRDPPSNARLPSSPSVTSSLESAAPSAGDHLIHPHGQLGVLHVQADDLSTRTRANVPKERRARQLLRGRTPEECGVKMYERALAAERQRQAR